MTSKELEALNIIFALLDVYAYSKLDGTLSKKVFLFLVVLSHLIILLKILGAI